MLFLWYTWKFHILNPSCLDFFWNIPIQQLFLNFIFEEYKFSSFNTSDRSNNSLRCLKSEKNPLRTNSILIRKTELNKVLIMVCLLKPEGLSGAMTTEQHYFFDTFFSTYIKDWPAKIYLYGSLNTCKFLELVRGGLKWFKMFVRGGDIYKVCKPTACSFMKTWTHTMV